MNSSRTSPGGAVAAGVGSGGLGHGWASPRKGPVVERVGSVVEQLAVLVSAGVAPVQAWRYLAEVVHDEFVVEVAAAAGRGVPVAEAITRSLAEARTSARAAGGAGRARRGAEADAWRTLAAAWFVATESGAPMRLCLDDIAGSLRQLGAVERDTTAALAGPAATARLVLLLPVIAVLGGALMGADPLGALLGTPVGFGCLMAGSTLTLVARWWSSQLLRRARRVDPAPGLKLELVAVAVGGGGSLPAARWLVDCALERYMPAARRATRASAPSMSPRAAAASASQPALASSASSRPRDPAEYALSMVLHLASRSGAPPALLLRSEAARLRRDVISAAQQRAAALGVWLMLPLGLCILPAFILLAVAPVLIGVLTAGPAS